MKKRNQKRNDSLTKQRLVGWILIGFAVITGIVSVWIADGNITGSILVGFLGLAAVLANGEVDESDEPYKLKFLYGKDEEES